MVAENLPLPFLCVKNTPDQISLLHLDDYFTKSEDAPKFREMINWDHPDSIKWQELYNDLMSLLQNKSIKILTKSELYNPEFEYSQKNKKEVVIESRPLIILEGYLALHDQKIRDLMSTKIYLDIPIKESTKRRSANKFQIDTVYLQEVLIPMHDKFVVTTKEYANLIIDVTTTNQSQMLQLVESKLGLE
ncbi:MAG: hypothetical protein R3B41_01190 [Candidatus Doudnabacteria bacterium]